MVRHRLLTFERLCVALPPVAVTFTLAILACMEASGLHPLTFGEPRSLPEAIVMRDGASVARLLERKGRPDEIEMIRRGVLLDRPLLVTPLEAAVIVDDAALLEILERGGAQISQHHLACLAADVGARAIRSRLETSEPCQPGSAWSNVLSRP